MLFPILLLVCLLLVGSPAWAANLESPAQGATLSGLGFISGWKCDAGEITVTINDGGHIPVATGQPRADTRVACGTLDNGFITQMNWNFLGTGKHTAVAYDDGVEFARSTFTVVTTGEEYLPDAVGECVVPDFPAAGENASFAWNTSTQHLELTDVGSHVTPPTAAPRHLFDGTWDLTLTLHSGLRCDDPPSARYTVPIVRSGHRSSGERLSGSFAVLEDGQIEGSVNDHGLLTIVGFYGFLSGRTGQGGWFSNLLCGGAWTAQKQ